MHPRLLRRLHGILCRASAALIGDDERRLRLLGIARGGLGAGLCGGGSGRADVGVGREDGVCVRGVGVGVDGEGGFFEVFFLEAGFAAALVAVPEDEEEDWDVVS